MLNSNKPLTGSQMACAQIGTLPAQQMQPPEPRIVAAEVDRLNKALAELALNLGDHFKRLEPVLLSAAPETGSNEGQAIEDLSPLGHQLRNASRQVEAFSAEISALRYRITV